MTITDYTPLFWSGIAAAAALLSIEQAFYFLKRGIRRYQIRRRRHCLGGHSWGRRFGPFKPTGTHSWYYARKCVRCPSMHVERIEDAEGIAHEYLTANGGWDAILERADKHREEEKTAKARKAVDSIVDLLRFYKEEWKETTYHLIHDRTGISIWIANGEYGTKIEKPVPMELPKEEKARLYSAITTMRSKT